MTHSGKPRPATGSRTAAADAVNISLEGDIAQHDVLAALPRVVGSPVPQCEALQQVVPLALDGGAPEGSMFLRSTKQGGRSAKSLSALPALFWTAQGCNKRRALPCLGGKGDECSHQAISMQCVSYRYGRQRSLQLLASTRQESGI